MVKWPLSVEPRAVQLEALSAGYGKEGFAFFLRQRLGKTWLTYAEFVLLRNEGKVDWFVVLCPNSLKEQWYDAIKEVDPEFPAIWYEASKKQKFAEWLKKNKRGAVIINYEGVGPFINGDNWERIDNDRTYVVADESTMIKAHNTKRTKACIDLANICKYRRILTGKPKANSNADLWPQLKFINATKRNFYAHRATFCRLGGFQGRQVIADLNTDLLREEMAPFCYIAPDKYLEGFGRDYPPIRRVSLPPEMARMYKSLEREFLVELANGAVITAPTALTKYLRLQQISSGIAGDVDGVQHNVIRPEHNPRIAVVKEILENEVEGKCIIVCRFRLSIDNLFNELSRDGYKCARIIGGMGDIERIKRDFNVGDTDILIAQSQVLSYGHTLPGNDDKPCADMIFYENDLSLINRAQCEARPEKVGRAIPISYHDMGVSKVDDLIIRKLRNKEARSLELMNYAKKFGIFGDERI